MMTADQVRQYALELAEAVIVDLTAERPDEWPRLEGGDRLTVEEVDAVRHELRVIAEGVAAKLDRLLPPPVQPVWKAVPR